MIKKHLNSYRYSVKGIITAFRSENNMIIHLVATIAVVVANVLLSITKIDWVITLIFIGLVWMAELFNTAIERLANRITKEQDPLIAQAKDIASGAVLIICVFAVIGAAFIYLPYL